MKSLEEQDKTIAELTTETKRKRARIEELGNYSHIFSEVPKSKGESIQKT